MHPPPSFSEISARLLTTARRWRLLRSTLLAAGIVLLGLPSAFLLTGRWDGPASAGARAEPQSYAPTVVAYEGVNTAAALARLDPDALRGGLYRLAVALQPTATPTPSPTPTATPTPRPAVPPAAPASVRPNPPPQSGCSPASMSGLALQLFAAINAERSQRGLPALSADGCVTSIAQMRSADMASRGYFSHTSPEGETAFSLLDRHGVSYGWAGENLARNTYPDGETVGVAVHDLMAHDSHRAIILGGQYTHVGIGVAADGAGSTYYAMIAIGPP